MKNFQVRLSDHLYNLLKAEADRREESTANTLRRCIEKQLEPPLEQLLQGTVSCGAPYVSNT